MSKNRRSAYLALVTTTLIWGIAFPLVKPAFEYVSPLQYLYLRFLVAGLVSLPLLVWYYIKSKPKISYMIKTTLIELVGITIPFYLLYEGLSKTSAIEASLLGSVTPFFVVIGGVWFLKEKESRREWQGLTLAFLGSLILVLEPVFTGSSISGSSLIGNLYIMAYNISYTIYALTAKHIYKSKPPLFLGSLSYLAIALVYGIILSIDHALPPISILSQLKVLLPVLYMAIPGGIIALNLHLYAVSKIEVSEANLFSYLNGVIAIPAAAILLHEYPTPLTILAIILIFFGVIRAESKKTH